MGIHTPTAFASALVQALPRLIAVDHVVYAEVRASPSAAARPTAVIDPLLEVLSWLAQGKPNPDIATILTSRPRTVAKHLERIFQKLGVETGTAAATIALTTPDW
jgi:DNA-binding NarL/FixJ family response regulator